MTYPDNQHDPEIEIREYVELSAEYIRPGGKRTAAHIDETHDILDRFVKRRETERVHRELMAKIAQDYLQDTKRRSDR